MSGRSESILAAGKSENMNAPLITGTRKEVLGDFFKA